MTVSKSANGTSGQATRAWWKEASVYQIYPSSFKDSNGDGVGDIPGVIEKLDYLKQLGVDIVWLCPVYKSPQVDMGYDVADYCDVDPRYGTLDDVQRLIKGLHSRGLKFLMDLVVNHTSDQHEWFRKSKASKTNEYRDWYIWRKPRYDSNGERQPPNNWSSYFGGKPRSAWEYDEASGEYYLHLFAKEQPDLNWEHPPVVAAVHDIMRFWLDMGVDGFRMDVINFISKRDGLPDAPITIPSAEFQHGADHYACGPRLHEYLHEMGRILKEYNAFSVGEMPSVSDPEEVLKSVGAARGELNMIFNFDIVDMDLGSEGKFSPKQWAMSDLKSIVNKWQTTMYDRQGWNALYLENHDQPRSISRWASDKPELRELAAKMFATFLCCQSGTVFVYQGQELGMRNMPEEWNMCEYRDLETLNHWEELNAAPVIDTKSLAIAREQYHIKSRDHARTPLQWDASANAGFTNGTPWIRVNDDYKTCNAASQVSTPASVFQYWRSLLSLRKEYQDVLIYGSFELVDSANEDIFAYIRRNEASRILVVCNFRDYEIGWKTPGLINILEGTRLASNYAGGPKAVGTSVFLRPFETFAILLN